MGLLGYNGLAFQATTGCGLVYPALWVKSSIFEVEVSFDVLTNWDDFEGVEPSSVPVTVGEMYGVLPDLGDREGYTFDGWFTAAVDGTLVTSATMVTEVENHVLFAQWSEVEAVTVTVSFDVSAWEECPSEFPPVDVTVGEMYGDDLPDLSEVVWTGHTFDGWFTEKVGGDLVTVETLVPDDGDHTLFAQWSVQTFEVRFVDWNDALLKSEFVEYGKSATAPANPSRSGYTFDGWSSAFNNVVSDLTVRAQYRQNSGSSGGSSSNKPSTPSTSDTSPPPTETPPEPPYEAVETWALSSLILSVAGVVLAILLVVCVLLQKKCGAEQQQKVNAKSQQCLTLGFIVTIVLSIAGVIVFFLTEDINLDMGIFNKWTVANAIIFIAEIITIMLYTKIRVLRQNRWVET